MNKTTELLIGVRGCIENIRVSGRTDCASVIACMNTLDMIIADMEKEEKDETAEPSL